MPYQLLADLIVLLHVAFVVFVVLGGLLALRWHSFVWIHLPAVTWAAAVEFFGWVCPLTPAENWLRVKAGQTGYPSDFIAHYILPLLYPDSRSADRAGSFRPADKSIDLQLDLKAQENARVQSVTPGFGLRSIVLAFS